MKKNTVIYPSNDQTREMRSKSVSELTDITETDKIYNGGVGIQIEITNRDTAMHANGR